MRFVASDGSLESDEATITLNINNVNDYPVVEQILDNSINEDQTFSIEINATDIDGDELEFSFESEENAILYFEDNILNIIG